MNIVSLLIPAIASIIVAVATGITTYYVTKNSDRTKSKIENELLAKNNILAPLYNCLSIRSIKVENLDQIISNIKKVYDVIYKDYNNYFVVPPEISGASENLQRLVANAENYPKSQWTEVLKKDIVEKYKHLVVMFFRFENIIRKDTCCPQDNFYQILKYNFGTPVIYIIYIVVFAICWISVLIILILYKQNFAVIIYSFGSMGLEAIIISFQMWWRRHKEKKYFSTPRKEKSQDYYCSQQNNKK